MKKDDLKTLVVVILACGIPLAIVLILNIKSNRDKLEVVNEYNDYFSIVSSVNKYLNYTSTNNKEAIYSLLDKEYITNNEVTINNVLDKVSIYPINTSVKITTMTSVNIKNSYAYYLKGSIIQNNYSTTEEITNNFEMIVLKDLENLTISLYPINNTNYKKVIDHIKKINIESNDYNKINNSSIVTKEEICSLYLSDYLNRIRNNIDSSYSLLSDNMKKQNDFNSLETYRNYINSNINKMSTSADKCFMEKIKDNRVYSVIDKNENKFVFNEESIMNYKVDIYLK